MRFNYKHFFLLLPLLSAKAINPNSICGKYEIKNSEWYNQTIIIKKTGLFVKIFSGCVYEIQSTGRWTTRGDTLILEISNREDLRTKREFKVDDLTDKYLIKADTLFEIDVKNEKVNFVADFALIKRKEE